MNTIRKVTWRDIPELKELYENTISHINSQDYTPEEIEDWKSCGESDKRWEELIQSLYLIAATNQKGKIIGFSSISPEGYLHSLFIHKDFQRQGIANLLYKEIEQYALNHSIKRITTEASITAKGFLEKQGFKIDEQQKRKTNHLFLTNYKMSKELE